MHPIITTIPGVYQERLFNFPKHPKNQKRTSLRDWIFRLASERDEIHPKVNYNLLIRRNVLRKHSELDSAEGGKRWPKKSG
jgi:hypothetical protein